MRIALLVLVVLVVACLLLIVTRPNTYHVERTAVVAAPPESVFAHVNDFHRWDAWSPWARLDPHMKTTYSGPAAGTGAVYAWSGNAKVGQGRMTVQASQPAQQVAIALEFLQPFPSSSVTTFTFVPEGAGTRVTWAMDGRSNFMSKAMSLFTSMDAMVGPDFARGLASLKAVSEGGPAAPPAGGTH